MRDRKRAADGACGYKCECVKELTQEGKKSGKDRKGTRQREIRASLNYGVNSSFFFALH